VGLPPEDEGDFFGLQHEIDGHEHGAEARERKAHRGEGMRVASQYRHPRTFGNALLRQPGRQAIADSVKFGVSPPDCPTRDSQLIGVLYGASMEQIAQGVSPRAEARRAPFPAARDKPIVSPVSQARLPSRRPNEV
jgi:hypothetical protein